MRRVTTVIVVVAAVVGVATIAGAFPGGGPMMRGGPGAGWGPMGGFGGYGGCPMWSGRSGTTPTATEQITEERARQLATDYAAKYFTGYTVERVLPFSGRFRTMYEVELKGPQGDKRVLHVTPWGGVRPFGPLS